MKETGRNFLVGIFVLGALLMLATLMTWFGETAKVFGGSEWTMTITSSHEIRGIAEGTAVLFSGVEIGRVKRLDFKDVERPWKGVLVVCRMKNRYVVPRNAIAQIHGAALGFGLGKINIIIPDESATEPIDRKDGRIPGEMAPAFGDILPPEFASSVDRMVEHIGNLAAAATPVAQNLSQLLEQRSIDVVDDPRAAERGVIANVSTVVERLDKLVGNVNDVLGDQEVQGDLKGIAADLKSSSEELHALVDQWRTDSSGIAQNVNQSIDHTEAEIAATLRQTNEVLAELDRSAKNLTAILDGIQRGEGTAGLLVRDPRLYEAAVLALRSIGETAATIQRVAGKIEEDGYITVGQKTVVGTLTRDFPVTPKDSGGR